MISLPPGYGLVRSVIGLGVKNLAGFGRLADPDTVWDGQQAWCFEKSGDWRTAVVVFLARSDAPPLALVGERIGVPLALGHGTVAAEYHDGFWTGSSMTNSANVAPRSLQWNEDIHSVTVWWAETKAAVRGPRALSVADLAAAALSVPRD